MRDVVMLLTYWLIFPSFIFNLDIGEIKDETVSLGSNKVLVGIVVGIMVLIAMAALIVAGLVMYRNKAPKKYKKLPRIEE